MNKSFMTVMVVVVVVVDVHLQTLVVVEVQVLTFQKLIFIYNGFTVMMEMLGKVGLTEVLNSIFKLQNMMNYGLIVILK